MPYTAGTPALTAQTRSAADRKPVASHHGYAVETIRYLTVRQWKPVFAFGSLHVVHEQDAIWTELEKQELQRLVAELHDGKPKCKQYMDYCGICEQVNAVASDPGFFDSAPRGVACNGTFYRVEDDRIVAEPLSPDHRQRRALTFEPQEVATPLFDRFLHETFRSEVAGEEAEQRALLQEVFGAVFMGLMPRFQKAVLFYDPYGRAGKGTTERIQSCLVPTDLQSAVSPFLWGREYHLADLAGKRLNVVQELQEGVPVPSAAFKSVLGGDLLSGRPPYKPVFSFRNEAAHVFASNHFITTTDQSAAFFARWVLIEFPNSLLKSGKDVDTGLADRIIASEIPGIAHWALEGAARLLRQGRFSPSSAHDKLLTRWKRSTNALEEFMFECCDFGPNLSEERPAFYVAYRSWCSDAGRKTASRNKVYEQLRTRIGDDIRLAVKDGYDIVRGLRLKAEIRKGMSL